MFLVLGGCGPVRSDESTELLLLSCSWFALPFQTLERWAHVCETGLFRHIFPLRSGLKNSSNHTTGYSYFKGYSRTDVIRRSNLLKYECELKKFRLNAFSAVYIALSLP